MPYVEPRRLIIRSDPQYTFALGAQLRPTTPAQLPGLSLLLNSKDKETIMRTIDFSPLYKSGIGFDQLPSLLDSVAQRGNTQSRFPHYNIELVKDDRYRITMAVAGFDLDELNIETEKQTLTISGGKTDVETEKNYLHQGIANRGFERKFQLADHVKVTNAKLENGLLHIELLREIPEAIKPKTIAINSGLTGLNSIQAA